MIYMVFVKHLTLRFCDAVPERHGGTRIHTQYRILTNPAYNSAGTRHPSEVECTKAKRAARVCESADGEAQSSDDDGT